jgi:hypothetical protein
MNKELIKQAAEDCHLRHGIGKTGRYYSIIVNHFLSFAKENGFELVRTDGILFAAEVVKDMIAKDRERMEFDIKNAYFEGCMYGDKLNAMRQAEIYYEKNHLRTNRDF